MTVGNYIYTPKIIVDNFQIYSDDSRDIIKEKEVLNWMKSKNFTVN